MVEIAREISRWVGRTIPYKDLPAPQYKQALAPAGFPAEIVELLVATDLAIARGDLDSNSRDLHALIARDTQSLRDVLAGLPKP
jgi:NAD(P)H dehydrogenase (quinone)